MEGQSLYKNKNRSDHKTFMDMSTIFKNKHMSMTTHIRECLKCYIKPILTYGCDSWTISRIADDQVGTSRNFGVKVREKQARCFGHVMRRDLMEDTVTTEKINGKKSIERKHVKNQDGIAVWLHRMNNTNFLQLMRDQGAYRDMITNAKAGRRSRLETSRPSQRQIKVLVG